MKGLLLLLLLQPPTREEEDMRGDCVRVGMKEEGHDTKDSEPREGRGYGCARDRPPRNSVRPGAMREEAFTMAGCNDGPAGTAQKTK